MSVMRAAKAHDLCTAARPCHDELTPDVRVDARSESTMNNFPMNGHQAEQEIVFSQLQVAANDRRALEVEGAALQNEAAFVRLHNGLNINWQQGCMFALGDNVVFDDKGGCVIGLPTQDDVEAKDIKAYKAWVRFEDGTRAWVPWVRLWPMPAQEDPCGPTLPVWGGVVC